jgi:PRTRC genetic system protein E
MFFERLDLTMTPGVDIALSVRKLPDGRMLVGLLPKMDGLKDAAQNSITPLTLTGTAAELDEGFFAAISQPVQRVGGLLTNMKQFEDQADKAEAERREVRQQKGGGNTPAAKQQTPFEKAMAKVAELEKEGRFNDAALALNKARAGATDEQLKTIDERKLAIMGKMRNAASLFDQPTATAQRSATAVQASDGGQPSVSVHATANPLSSVPYPFTPGDPFARTQQQAEVRPSARTLPPQPPSQSQSKGIHPDPSFDIGAEDAVYEEGLFPDPVAQSA